MKINNNYLNIEKLYQKQHQKVLDDKRVKNRTLKKDTLELSPEAQKIKELTKKALELPEIREEKVKEIKEKIKNNTYFVSEIDLAKKMLSKNRI